MHIEDAMRVIAQFAHEGLPDRLPSFGYDVYLPNVVRAYLQAQGVESGHGEGQKQHQELTAVFFDAGWVLCQRGILRPGIQRDGVQALETGQGGGYSITPFGREWLKDPGQDPFVPTEPERFAELLSQYHKQFGDGYQGRGQEAVRCYSAGAFLACCAMSGAAVESILLATAIEKTGNENAVLKQYRRSGGRQIVENIIVGQATERLRADFHSQIDLIKYWRDEAAHGLATDISANEAFTSLVLVLRCATFIDANWENLARQ